MDAVGGPEIVAVVELEEDEQGEEETGHSCYVRIHLEETTHYSGLLQYFFLDANNHLIVNEKSYQPEGSLWLE